MRPGIAAAGRRALAELPLVALAIVLIGTGVELLPPDELLSLGPVKLTLQRLLIVAGLLALLAGPARIGIGALRSGFEIPIAALLLAGLLATASWEGTEPRMRFLVEAVLVFFLCLGVLRSRPDARWAVVAVGALAVLIPAATGVAQVAQEFATGFYRDGCLPVEAPPPLIPDGVLVRATGTFQNPNVLAGHLLLLAPLGVLAALGAGRRDRLGLGLAAALGYLALALTLSRSAVVLAVAALVLLALTGAGRRPALLAVAGVGLALIAAALLGTCGVDGASGDHGRLDTWRDTVELATDEPFRGVGLGRTPDRLRAANPDSSFLHGHNLWLTWWAEAGTLALLAWIAIAAMALLRTWRAARAGDALGRGLFVALSTFFAFSMLDHPANVDRVALTLWVVLAIAATVRPPDRDAAEQPSSGQATMAEGA